MARTQAQARRRLDERFGELRSTGEVARPPRGWIRAIRDAIGMSSPEMAARLGVSQQAVMDMERNEEREVIGLDTLQRAADALGCDLVYYLLPRTGLEDAVQQQARRKALAHLEPIAHNSLLELQGVSDSEFAAQLEELTEEFRDRRGLWSPEGER